MKLINRYLGSRKIKSATKILFLCSLLPGLSYAGADNQNFGTLNVLEVTSIYDGDTFRANIANVHPLLGKRIGIRVAGVDTPEIKGQCKKEKELASKANYSSVLKGCPSNKARKCYAR